MSKRLTDEEWQTMETFDFYDSENRRASITIRWGELWHTEHRLIAF